MLLFFMLWVYLSITLLNRNFLKKKLNNIAPSRVFDAADSHDIF